MQNQLFFSAVYARVLLRSGVPGLPALDTKRLLAGTALGGEELARHDYLGWQDVRQMLANIESNGAAPDWPMRFAAQLTLASHGPMGFAALSAPTLGDAIGVLADYHATRIATLAVEQVIDRGGQSQAAHRHLRIVLHELTGDAHFGRQILEIAVQVLLTLVETIVGHPLMQNVRVHFAYPDREPGYTLPQLLGVPCTYGHATNEIFMPHSWLNIASPLYDESTYRANLIKCREQLAALLTIKRDPAEWIKHRLGQFFDNGMLGGSPEPSLPDLASCAAALNMSMRTLVRRLQAQNTSYKNILEFARRERALSLLQSTHCTVAEIASVLGYSDAANFIRAFRRWYEASPTEWRKQNRVGAGALAAVK